MGNLIEDLLKLSRYTRRDLDIKDLDLSRMAEDLIADLRAREPGSPAEFSVQPGLRGRGDETLIGAVLENLLGNAFKFSSRKAAPRIEFGAQSQGERLEYFVQDNGAGFDTAHASKLFTPPRPQLPTR